MASVAVVMAVAIAAAVPAAAGNTVVEAGDLPVLFNFGVSPRKLLPTKPQPVRVLVSGKYETSDESHVPALDELELELDRHLSVDVDGVPICLAGTLKVRHEVLEGCQDAVVGKGTIEAEVAFPETPMVTVPGTMTIYNRGRKPDGADLAAWAYFPAPITAGIFITVKVRRIHQGRYGWKAYFEIPKIAGGAGSITAYSALFRKRIFSATCADGKMVARALSTFADGTKVSERAIRTCSVAEPHVRRQAAVATSEVRGAMSSLDGGEIDGRGALVPSWSTKAPRSICRLRASPQRSMGSSR